MIWRALFILFFSGVAHAQDEAVAATTGTGAILRGLDKVDGEVIDYEMRAGEWVAHGTLTVELKECRYPTENPAGDAFAYVVIHTDTSDGPVFSGWMMASSPALNALDHPRYDIWVLRCTSE